MGGEQQISKKFLSSQHVISSIYLTRKHDIKGVFDACYDDRGAPTIVFSQSYLNLGA